MARSNQILNRKKLQYSLIILVLILVGFLAVSVVIQMTKEKSSLVSSNITNVNHDLEEVAHIAPSVECAESNDVQTCWDGSDVRTIEPTCAFAPCINLPQQEDWFEYRNEKFGYTIEYPLRANVLWEPEEVVTVGVEEAQFMNSCAVVAAIPSATKLTKEFGNDIRAFIFSDEVKALNVGETAKSEKQNEAGGLTTFSYKRSTDKVIGGVSWKAYQWGNTWEMHSGEIHYTQTFGDISYVLVVREGGSCPIVGPAKVIETFSRLSK